MVVDDRGQAHTLEAVVAGLLLLSSVIFALQMTAVTPLSASTSSQHIENQQRSVAQGVLASAAERGSLKSTILYWNDTEGEFYGVNSIGYYTGDPPGTTFGRMLERTFDQRGISYNVDLVFETPAGDQKRKRLVYRGVPSDNAIVAARTVTLTDFDPLYEKDGRANHSAPLNDSSSFYISDVGGAVYNVVRVEVVAWRI